MASVAKEGMRNPVFQQNCEQSAVVIIMPLNKHGFNCAQFEIYSETMRLPGNEKCFEETKAAVILYVGS